MAVALSSIQDELSNAIDKRAIRLLEQQRAALGRYQEFRLEFMDGAATTALASETGLSGVLAGAANIGMGAGLASLFGGLGVAGVASLLGASGLASAALSLVPIAGPLFMLAGAATILAPKIAKMRGDWQGALSRQLAKFIEESELRPKLVAASESFWSKLERELVEQMAAAFASEDRHYDEIRGSLSQTERIEREQQRQRLHEVSRHISGLDVAA